MKKFLYAAMAMMLAWGVAIADDYDIEEYAADLEYLLDLSESCKHEIKIYGNTFETRCQRFLNAVSSINMPESIPFLDSPPENPTEYQKELSIEAGRNSEKYHSNARYIIRAMKQDNNALDD